MNTVALMGRLTYEPELRSTNEGVSVLRFQIAINRRYQKAGEERKADFIDCVAWRDRADFISRYFHKGSMIAVEGSIQTQTYTDKNDNQRKSVEVEVNNVSFCGSRSETEGDSYVPAPQQQQQNRVEQPAPSYSNATGGDFEEIIDDEEDDDLPF